MQKALIDLFLAAVFRWHIAAGPQPDGYAWFYFINEHVLRHPRLREPHGYPLDSLSC